MPQIHVLYTPLRVQYQGTGIDTQAVLERLRSMVGSELAAGWSLVNSLPVSGSSGSWLVTMEHDLDAVCEAVRERTAWAADPEFKLWQDVAASTRTTATIAAPQIPEPEPEPEQEPLRLPLPLNISPVLLQSEVRLRKRAAIFGVLLGIILAVAMGLLVPHGNVIRQMFDPRTPSAAVPTAILCLFFWGIMQGLYRRKKLNALDPLNGANLLPAVVEGLRSHGVTGLDEALKNDIVPYSPLLRRVRVILEQWIIRPSMQNANLAVEQQIIYDQDETQRGYNLLKIFVWATPLLGLIGAVVGISIAMGGFAHFLSTGVDDISRIKEGLVGVTGGLSFAFLITLEGLLSSLILMLFTAGIQTREERFYAGIEHSLAEEFLPELQRAAPEQEPQSSDLWAASIVETTQKVMEVIDAAGQKLMTDWDERHKSYLAELESAQKIVERSTLNIVQALENGTTAIGFQLAQTVAAQKALLEKMLEEAGQGLQVHGADLKGSTQIVVTSLQHSSNEIGGQIKSVVDALDEAAEKHRNLTQQAFIESSQALAEYSGETIRAAAALNDLGKVTEQVLQSQANLQTAIDQLGDSKLADLLAELDATLKDLKPVLSNLSQPFVLQAVPVKSNQP
jgi:biopolymer transport protein ExbB/TolQ